MKRHRPRLHPRRGLPRQIPLQPIARLLIRQTLMSLQDHHRGQHPRRDRRTPQPRVLVQIREIVDPEDPLTMLRQKPVNPLQPVPQQHPGIIEAGLTLHPTKRHTQSSQARTQIANPPRLLQDAPSVLRLKCGAEVC